MTAASPTLTSTTDIAAMLERFVGFSPGLGPYEWDDFESCSFSEPRLEAWRQRVLREIGHLVAPMRQEDEPVVADRVNRLIAALKKDENAQD